MTKRKKWLKEKTIITSSSCLLWLFFITRLVLTPAYGSPVNPTPVYDGAKSNWTVMVYMDGDNNLEPNAIVNFIKFAKFAEDKGIENNVNILVQLDRIWGYDTSYNNWTTTRRFEVLRGSKPVKTDPGFIKDLGELDMGEPGTLIDFVKWAKNYRPAEKYMLIMIDHGFGWKQGLCKDETNEDFLTTAQLRSALHKLTANGKQKIDVLVFDACQMAMAEIDYQINRYCKFRVASESDVVDNFLDYAQIIKELVEKPGMPAIKLASIVANNYKPFSIGGFLPMYTATLGTGYVELVKAVDQLAAYLKEHLTDWYFEIWNSIGGALHLNDWEYVDLYNIAERLKSSCSGTNGKIIRRKAQAVMNGIHNVISKNGKPINTGISIYFPRGRNSYFDFYDGKAGLLNFTADTCWDEFIKEYQTNGNPYNLASCINGGQIKAVGGESDTNTAKNLIDNGFSCWASEPGKAVFGNFVTVELAVKEPYFIDKIYLDPGPVDKNNDYMLNLFHIDLSCDGKKFETVFWGKIDPTFKNQFKIIDISAMKKKAKFVKVVVDSNQVNQLYSQVIISEMQVYGHSSEGNKKPSATNPHQCD